MNNPRQKSGKHRSQIEANARRKVAKRWAQLANSTKYKIIATKHSCVDVTSEIINECFDGILLDLKERSSAKSYNVQKRILRRIVEKRQAQSVHRTLGRSSNRYANHLESLNISRSMNDIHNYRFCV